MEETVNQQSIDPYEGIKSNFSKFAIFVWEAYGVYALFTHKMSGLITMVVYFVGGLFIASFASIIPYLVQRVIAQRMTKAHTSDSVASLTSYILLAVQVVWVIFIAIIFLGLINNH